jgi:hypothetical protein
MDVVSYNYMNYFHKLNRKKYCLSVCPSVIWLVFLLRNYLPHFLEFDRGAYP